MTSAEQVGGPLAEHLALVIPRAARNRHKRFLDVPAEDFEQAMWVRVLASPAKFRRLLEDGHHGTIWLELLNAGTKLGYEDERYRRTVKAKAAGYKPEDEEFYGDGMLALLLPVLIESGFNPARAVERAGQSTDAAGVRIQSSEPGSAAETYMVMLIDVAQAFGRLKPHHQRALTDYYELDQSDTDQGRWARESKASSMGMTLKAFQSRAYRARAALAAELGGRSPWIRTPDSDDDTQAA